jgi:drug/metabolite transporter (DMT)-like permease
MHTTLPPTTTKRLSCALPLGFAYIFLMSGGRFFLAGLLLLLGIAFFDRAGFRRGTLREWKDAGVIGFLLLVFGIGAGNWAQQYVDSSFAAMVFSGVPLWMILVDWIRPGGRAPTRTVAMALLLGFVGIGVILAPTGTAGGKTMNLGVNILLVLASIAWASGAIFSRHHHARGSALLPVARQMIVAGTALFLAGCVHGDLAHLDLAVVRLSAWLGVGYLIVIGSLGGYTTYIWLMRSCPPAKVGTVPYVNLIVAVFLGWSLGHETITPRLLIGTAIVLSSVAIVLRTRAPEVVPAGD